MLDVRYSTKFKKDYKAIIKRGYNPQLLVLKHTSDKIRDGKHLNTVA